MIRRGPLAKRKKGERLVKVLCWYVWPVAVSDDVILIFMPFRNMQFHVTADFHESDLGLILCVSKFRTSSEKFR